MFRKNVAGQFIHIQGVDSSTGGIKSGVTWTMRRCIDGTFAAGGATITEDGTTGWYKVALAQADTNGNNIGFNFTGTGAVPQTVNIVTTACDPTSTAFGLSLAKTTNITGFNDIAATAVVSGGAITTSGGAVSTVTTATNVTTVNGLAAGVITATSIAASALNGKGDWNVGKTGYSLTATTGLGNQTANITGTITTATNVTNNVNAVLANTAHGGAAASMNLASGLTANITGNLSGSVGSVTGAVGSVTGAVGSVTGNVGGNVVGSVASVTAAVTIDAGSVDAVWDEAIAGHLGAGSTGAALNAAGAAGDPWSTSIPGAYGAGTAGYIVGNNLDAAVSSRLATAGYTAPDNASISAILLDTGTDGVVVAAGSKTGYSLTAGTGLGNQTADITGSLSGSVGSVTAAVTAGTVSDKTGYRLDATGSAAMTEGYAALGAAGTLPQILYEIRAMLMEKSIASTTLTTKKLDGATTAATYTLDDATTPTSITRAT